MRKHAFFYLLLFTLLIPAAYGQTESLQTYSDSFIRFQYPADWAQCPCDPAENTTAVGNTEEALYSQGETFAGEMVQVAIIKSYQRQTGISEPLTAVEIAEGMKTRGTANYGEILELPSGVVRMDFTSETFGVAVEGIVLVVELGNGDAAVLNAVSPLGYFAPFETAVIGIAETRVLEEATPQTVTFQPPVEWVVQEVDSNFVVMAANQEMLDRLYPDSSTLKKGDVLLTLYKSLDGFLGNVMDVSASPDTFFPDLPFFLGYEDVTFGEVEQTGRFARVTGRSSTTEITLVFVDLGNGDKSLLILTTPAGAASKSEALLMQTAESISLGSATNEPISAESLTLDTVFSLSDGSLSLNHPGLWDVQEYEGLIFMANNSAIYSREAPLDTLESGEVVVVIYPTLESNSNYTMVTGSETASTVISFYASMYYITAGFENVAPMEILTLENGNELSSVEVSTATSDILVVAVSDAAGHIVTLEVYTAPGQIEQFKATVLEMAETVSLH